MTLLVIPQLTITVSPKIKKGTNSHPSPHVHFPPRSLQILNYLLRLITAININGYEHNGQVCECCYRILSGTN